MSIVSESNVTDLSPELDRLIQDRVDALVTGYLTKDAAKKRRRIAIIATQGTLDMAYPPLILGTAAAALGWEVGLFFTFYGLNIVHKEKGRNLQVAPVGNPAMPSPVPMPNMIAALPGMTPMATMMMKSKFKQHQVMTIQELLDEARASGVRLIPCGMTCDVFGYAPEDMIDGTEEFAGAASFLRFAADADISLFI